MLLLQPQVGENNLIHAKCGSENKSIMLKVLKTVGRSLASSVLLFR